MKFDVKIYHKKYGFDVLHIDAETMEQCRRIAMSAVRERGSVWYVMEINEAEEQKEVAKGCSKRTSKMLLYTRMAWILVWLVLGVFGLIGHLDLAVGVILGYVVTSENI